MGLQSDSQISPTDRLAGAVWGHLVGDAMGVPYEFGPPVPVGNVRWGHQSTYRPQPPGTWSDDGGLMLALLDSLVEVGFDPVDQGRRALDWWLGEKYKPGPIFDIGNITRESLSRIRDGTKPEIAGGAGDDDNGNGSLMRVLPIALTGYGGPHHELADLAMRASSLTHRHPRSKVTCAVYVLVAAELLRGATDRGQVLAQVLAETASLLSGRDREALQLLESYPSRTGGGYVVNSFWSAWDAFAGSDSFEKAIKRAISYGDDTDTTACVAGGLAGIYWGRSGIPIQWLSGMRGTAIVEPILTKLLTHVSS